MTILGCLYHENMAAFDISEIIELIPKHKLTASSVCNEESEFDVNQSLSASLANPINFPTLDQAILKEDSVCIAIEPGIPDEELIASETAATVSGLGVDQSQITILLPEGTSSNRVEAIRKELKNKSCEKCPVVVHHANEPENIGYLGPSESGEPITLNARLVHADFVLPISRAKPFGWKSKIDFLYPYYSDLESQKRFFKLSQKNRIMMNQEVHRWLGNCFLITVATRIQLNENGERQVIGMALTGENDSVQLAIQNHCLANSGGEKPVVDSSSHFDLVIARLNPHLCVSEEEIKDVVDDLRDLCAERGSIVLIWNDDCQVPVLVERDAEVENATFGALNDSRQIYLQSEQGLLHQLGMSRINSRKELETLVERHESVLVLPDFINDFAFHRHLLWNDKSTGAMA